jgi:hypothetical protein
MDAAETAVFLELELLRSTLFVLGRCIVPVLAFGTGKGNDVSHYFFL